ncbi:type II toxin-antitoxin system HicA family toxin [Reyranella sp.]|uniref:type II toxin-antitoxin system HicA family toxin n=1 Tax=Reyranella sp. TaxID=1929291 RepID=UPI003D1224C3
MRLPRDLSGVDLAKALGRVGYRVVRQTGSHLRLSRDGSTQHHITIPAHDPLKKAATSRRAFPAPGARAGCACGRPSCTLCAGYSRRAAARPGGRAGTSGTSRRSSGRYRAK